MFDDNVFHAHLEHCERCRFRPSDLCVLGGQLLELQVRRGNKSLSLKMGIRNVPLPYFQVLDGNDKVLSQGQFEYG